MKFGSVEQIVAEADKAMRRRMNEAASVDVSDNDVKKVRDCGDGYAIYRLKTPAALDREGFEMGHCVGQGAYDHQLGSNFVAIYSLRDGFGKSHVTIEVNAALDFVEQIRGKQNGHPKPEYMRRLVGWIEPHMEIAASEIPPGFAVDRIKGLVELAAMKPGDVFTGNFKFDFDGKDECVLPLPDGVVVRGDIAVSGGDLISRMGGVGTRPVDYLPRLTLPAGLKVEGTVHARFCNIDFPEMDARRLHLEACAIAKLPAVVTAQCEFERSYRDMPDTGNVFTADVTVERCGYFGFGPDTSFLGEAWVYGTKKVSTQSLSPALSFGKGTTCEGAFRIKHSDVAFLGTLTCQGDLTIADCDDVRMPESLSVGGDLVVRETFIDRWPAELSVAGGQTYDKVDQLGRMDTVPESGDAGPEIRPGLAARA